MSSLPLTPVSPGSLTLSPTTYTVGLLVSIPSAGIEGIVVRAAAGQTASIQEWQSSAATVLTKVDSAGVVHGYVGEQLGNDADSTYYAGTGSPPTYTIPYRLQHIYGKTAGGVVGTTQAFAGWAVYGQPTSNDSAEAASWGIILKDAYVGNFTQTLPAVAFEADALCQGVTITNKLISFVAGLKVQAGSANNSTVTTGIQFYCANATVDASQTLTNWYGIYVETPTVNGTLTNKWALYAKDLIQTEGGLIVGTTSSTAARVLIVNRASSADPGLVVSAGSGQTGRTFETRDSSNNPLWGLDTAGIPQWVATANQQTTVGAAGGASALPASPVKYLKVKDSGGTTYVVPAYLAS